MLFVKTQYKLFKAVVLITLLEFHSTKIFNLTMCYHLEEISTDLIVFIQYISNALSAIRIM